MRSAVLLKPGLPRVKNALLRPVREGRKENSDRFGTSWNIRKLPNRLIHRNWEPYVNARWCPEFISLQTGDVLSVRVRARGAAPRAPRDNSRPMKEPDLNRHTEGIGPKAPCVGQEKFGKPSAQPLRRRITPPAFPWSPKASGPDNLARSGRYPTAAASGRPRRRRCRGRCGPCWR